MTKQTRVSIISGFLGAGKTSLLCHLLRSVNLQKTAVLVNEIGDIGVDGDLIEDEGKNIDLRQLIGGCICCTSLPIFRQTLVNLLRSKPEQLFIEPSGIAGVGSLLTILAEPGLAPYIQIDPVMVVMDPRQWERDKIRKSDLYKEQSSHADIIVISHSDVCEPKLLENFKNEFSNTPQVLAKKGVLERPLNLTQSKPATLPFNFGGSEPTVDAFFSETLSWPKNTQLDISTLKSKLINHPMPSDVLRCKGIILSSDGAYSVQMTHTSLNVETCSQTDNSFLVMIAWKGDTAKEWWNSIKDALSDL